MRRPDGLIEIADFVAHWAEGIEPPPEVMNFVATGFEAILRAHSAHGAVDPRIAARALGFARPKGRQRAGLGEIERRFLLALEVAKARREFKKLEPALSEVAGKHRLEEETLRRYYRAAGFGRRKRKAGQ